MNKSKLTPWFPADVKPVRPGIYEVDCAMFANPSYSYFDGGRFNSVYSQPDWAQEAREVLGCGYFVKNWRGLAEQPK